MIGDEDEIDGGVEPGTEGQGTTGQDTGGGQPEAELPAEHADDAADDGEPEVTAEGGERPSRAETRFQKLANETKAAREEAAEAKREAQELRRERAQQSNQVNEQQQREMLALMTPDERADYKITQFERRQAQQSQHDRITTLAMHDKIAFDAKATVNPVYSKHAPEIERQFQELMGKGTPVERQILLERHIGKLALEGARNPKARQQGRQRVDAQRVSPGGSRSDAATARGKAGDTPGERLRDVII